MSIKFVNRLKAAGTICFTAILSILTIPAYSTDLPSGALCNEDNLNTDTGPVDIEVTWEPNTINTTWYSEGTQVSGPASCTYNAVMTLPSNRPTRSGYTFAGWRLRAPQCSVPSADISTNPTISYGHGWQNDSDYCSSCVPNEGCGPINCSTVSDLSLHQWKTTWANGDVVKGIASCQSTAPADMLYIVSNYEALLNNEMSAEDYLSGYIALAGQEKGAIAQQALQVYAQNGAQAAYAITYPQLLTMPSNTNFATNSTGQYCFCKATHYTANNAQQCSLSSTSWVFYADDHSAADCAGDCARYCARYVRDYSGFRMALFGQ